MKLAVSNIAWDNAELSEHLALIRDLGCDGVELAPSCVWPEPAEVAGDESAGVTRLIRRAGLEVTGFLSLLYTRRDLQLFQDAPTRRRTIDYLGALGRLCAEMGGKVLVFGSPKNRARHGHTTAECLDWAVEVFSQAAREAQRAGVTLCIEPLSPEETDFIQSSAEGLELVRRVDQQGFGLHLDAKAMLASREDPEAVLRDARSFVRHVHVGDPGLAPPGSTGADHAPIGRALRRSGYRGYVSIEMRRGFGPSREVIANSVAYVKQHYLESHEAIQPLA